MHATQMASGDVMVAHFLIRTERHVLAARREDDRPDMTPTPPAAVRNPKEPPGS